MDTICLLQTWETQVQTPVLIENFSAKKKTPKFPVPCWLVIFMHPMFIYFIYFEFFIWDPTQLYFKLHYFESLLQFSFFHPTSSTFITYSPFGVVKLKRLLDNPFARWGFSNNIVGWMKSLRYAYNFFRRSFVKISLEKQMSFVKLCVFVGVFCILVL